MANEKVLNTRISLKYDTLTNWQNSAFNGADSSKYLKAGEVAIVTLAPNAETNPTATAGQHPLLFKVGTGNHKFDDLPWTSALAADVYEWAKQNNVKIEGAGNAVTNVSIKKHDGKDYLTFEKDTTFATKAELDAAIEAFGGDLSAITDNDHQYTFDIVEGSLEIKATNYVNGKAGEAATVATLDFITPDELRDVLEKGYKTLQNAYSKEGSTVKTITKVEQNTNGVIDVTYADIAFPDRVAESAKADVATQLDNALTVTIGGEDIEFDGSDVATVDIDAAIAAAIEAEGHPEYSIAKVTTTTGYSATYQLTKDGTAVGAKIDIPKDMVVSKGEVITYENAGAWGSAGTYIVLTLANATNDTLYIPAAGLIEYVTSGSTANSQVIVAIDENTHKVTATIGAGKITATELATNAVTTDKIADKNVTEGKLEDKVQSALALARTAIQEHQDLSGYVEKATSFTNGNIAVINGDGGITDGGYQISQLATQETVNGLQAQLDVINNGTDGKGGILAEAKSYADGLADNYATKAQGEKADTAVQTISTPKGANDEPNGLKAVKSGTDVAISFDDTVVFVFDCGTASVNV